MKKNITTEIIKILNKFNKIKKENLNNIANYEYLNNDSIDSLQLIHFILNLEKKFKIIFSSKDKESANFRTIGGLVKIIKQKLG